MPIEKVQQEVRPQLEVDVVVTKKTLFWFLLWTLAIHNVFAEMLLPKTTKVKFLLNVYDQDSSNGAQVFDGSGNEGVSVLEPMIFISHQIDESTNLNGHFVFDAWTAESDTRLDGETGQSGAGIEGQSRVSGSFGMSKVIGKNTWSPRIGFSSEYDYRSLNTGLNWTGSFAKDNFTLGIGANLFFDQALRFDYTNEKTNDKWESKQVYALDISASQLLTRSDIIAFSLTGIYQTGTLESIRNTIEFNGSRYPEEYPKTRKRYAAGSQWVHGFSDTLAASLKYRYYTDSWDMKAHTIEPSLRFSLQEDEGFLELNYRYHTQDQVKYFSRTYSSLPEFRTNDSDLEKYHSQRIGLHYGLELGESDWKVVQMENTIFSFGAYHYFRSNSMKSRTVQFSYGVEF